MPNDDLESSGQNNSKFSSSLHPTQTPSATGEGDTWKDNARAQAPRQVGELAKFVGNGAGQSEFLGIKKSIRPMIF